jgi:hypothetical protein
MVSNSVVMLMVLGKVQAHCAVCALENLLPMMLPV